MYSISPVVPVFPPRSPRSRANSFALLPAPVPVSVSVSQHYQHHQLRSNIAVSFKSSISCQFNNKNKDNLSLLWRRSPYRDLQDRCRSVFNVIHIHCPTAILDNINCNVLLDRLPLKRNCDLRKRPCADSNICTRSFTSLKDDMQRVTVGTLLYWYVLPLSLFRKTLTEVKDAGPHQTNDSS